MKSSLVCATLHQSYPFAQSVADFLQSPLHIPTITRFADGELELALWQEFLWPEKEILLIAPTAYAVHDELVKACFFIDMVKRRGVKKITWLVPYCGYARQCEDQSGNHLGHMAVVARMMESSGVDELIIIEPHDDLKSLFGIPVHEIFTYESIAYDIQMRFPELTDCCVVAPDQGARERVTLIADLLHLPIVNAVKQRFDANQTRIIGIHGYEGYKRAILIDDIIDTGGTALSVAQGLQDLGVEEIHGYFVHGIFSSGIESIIATSLFNTIAISPTVIYKDKPRAQNRVHIFELEASLAKIKKIIKPQSL